MGTAKDILIYLSVFSPVLPLSTYFILKNKPLAPVLRVLFFYLLFSLSTDLICLSFVFKNYNNSIIEIYAVIEILIIISIYKRKWNSSKMDLGFNLLSLTIIISSVVMWFSVKDLDVLKNYLPASRALIVVIIAILFFFKLIDNLNLPTLTGYYFFWFNAAFFIYFSVFLCVLLFKNYILNSHSSQSVQNLWLLHNSFHIIYNVLLGVGLYKWKIAKA